MWAGVFTHVFEGLHLATNSLKTVFFLVIVCAETVFMNE